MKAIAHPWTQPRTALLLALFAALAWLLAQGCTLLWQAAGAESLAQRLAAGQPLYAWDFTDPAAVVWPGSEGLDGASQDAQGLGPAETAPVVDVSLQLPGRPVAGQAYAAARLLLDTGVPARVLLLAPSGAGGSNVVAETAVGPGEHAIELALKPFATAAGWLRLRIERAATGPLLLRTLALVAPRCVPRPQDAVHGPEPLPAECDPGSVRLLPAASTPEAVLGARDALLGRAPAAIARAAHVPRVLADAARALHADWFHAIALLAALGVLAWSLQARHRARRARAGLTGGSAPGDAAAAAGPLRELLLLLGVPVLLLLAGQPDHHDHPLVLLALLASFAAALLHPGGRADWRWLGDRAAWAAAARFTLVGALLVGALALAGALAGESPGHWRSARLPRYLAWALLQQALLLRVIMPRLAARDRDPGVAAACAGGVFALLHLPNFGLMLATLLGGTAWAAQGRRHGALLPLAASHAVLGSLLVGVATPWLLRSAEVGGRFLMPG